MSVVDFDNLYGTIIYSYKQEKYVYKGLDKMFNMIKSIMDLVDFVIKQMCLLWLFLIWKQTIGVIQMIIYLFIFNIIYGILCGIRRFTLNYNIRHQKLEYLLEQLKTIPKTVTYCKIIDNKSLHKLVQKLNSYNITMNSWPIIYESTDIVNNLKSINYNDNIFVQKLRYLFSYYITVPIVYPGATFILNKLMKNYIINGRLHIQELLPSYRYLINTSTNDIIDTIFIDKRSLSNDGQFLLITSEGNAGYYEIGLLQTLTSTTRYSCLGWNTPGFAESKGVPFCTHIQSSIISVVEYALNHLGFNEQNIILLGWSIGGYPSAYAASRYNSIKCLILDATFDNIEFLATLKYPLLKLGIDFCFPTYFALNNSKILQNYSGQIKIILRSYDEIMSEIHNDITIHHTMILTLNILKYRYPNIFIDDIIKLLQPIIATWIKTTTKTYENGDIIDYSNDTILEDIPHPITQFPCISLGENLIIKKKLRIALYLLGYYLCIVPTDHCFTYDRNLFEIPKIKL